MAVRVADTIKPFGSGKYPIVESVDVQTTDGDLQTVLDNISTEAEEKDYDKLKNIPKLNGFELRGEMSANQLRLVDGDDAITLQEIDEIFNGIFV